MPGNTRCRQAIGVLGRFHVPALRRRAAADQKGMVLLETALAIPLLAAVAVALAWGISLGATSMALGDAARLAAREIARGVDVSVAVAAAQAEVPAADVQVEEEGGSVIVIAVQDVAPPGPLLTGLAVTLSQRVAVPREWT